MEEKTKCFVCEADSSVDYRGEIIYYDCPICGKYIISDATHYMFPPLCTRIYWNKEEIKSYLFYNKKKDIYRFIGDTDSYNKYLRINPQSKSVLVTPEIVDEWYPKTFMQKIDLILLKLYMLSPYDGAIINIEKIKFELLFCKELHSSEDVDTKSKDVQVEYIIDFLVENGLIKYWGTCVQLTPKALARIYEIQKYNVNSKDIFVSMAFNEGTKSTREAIRKGITDAGYSADFIDEIIHNHQIVPEMFDLIRKCKYLILEISDPNYGAYYEGGYALGLGKEVIICCSKEVFNKIYITEEEKKFEKYLKPHFDIAQKQILIWDNFEDLTNKLTKWIQALD